MSILSTVKEIAAGWKNYAFTDPAIEKRARMRARICGGCKHRKHDSILDYVGDEIVQIQGLKCGLCGCGLSAKTRSPESSCPAGYWGAGETKFEDNGA